MRKKNKQKSEQNFCISKKSLNKQNQNKPKNRIKKSLKKSHFESNANAKVKNKK